MFALQIPIDGGTSMRKSRLPLISGLILLATVLLAAGCGSSNNETGTSGNAAKTATPGINEPKSPEVANKVPKSIASTGKLVVAADATYAPDEFVASDG